MGESNGRQTLRAYSVRRLSEEWDCPPKVVYNLIESGELEAFMIGEKRGYRIRVEEIERWERENLKRTGAMTADSDDETTDTLSSTAMRALANG
jgi:excisionase family DNA binding protein